MNELMIFKYILKPLFHDNYQYFHLVMNVFVDVAHVFRHWKFQFATKKKTF